MENQRRKRNYQPVLVYDRNHFMVSPEYKYTITGWFWVTFVGVTTEPIKATYKCRRCKETVEVVTTVNTEEFDQWQIRNFTQL